jgi:hypothetical protein
MKTKTIIPRVLFAVSDFQDVLVLDVVSHTEVQGCIKVETELSEPSPSESKEAQYEAYFKKLYLTMDGNPQSSTVFLNINTAMEFARKNLKEAIDRKKREIDLLEKKLDNYDI